MSDLTGFSEKLEITIKNPEGNPVLLDYPVKVLYDTATPYAGGLIRSDLADLRVTDYTETNLLPFFVEQPLIDTACRIWVKVPSIPADGGTVTIYIYHGNASADVPCSNGDMTFRFFGDFGYWIQYRSDFSADTDGWHTLSGATLSQQAGPVGDGQHEVLQSYASLDTNFHIGDGNAWDEGGAQYILEFDYFAEAGCGLDYFGLRGTYYDAGTGTFQTVRVDTDSPAVDTGFWQRVSIPFEYPGVNGYWSDTNTELAAFNATTGVVRSVFASGKNIWLKNIRVKQVGVWDEDKWTSPLPSGRWPVCEPGQAEFDGNSSYPLRKNIRGTTYVPLNSAVEHSMSGAKWGWRSAWLGGVGVGEELSLSGYGSATISQIYFHSEDGGNTQESNQDGFSAAEHVYSCYNDVNEAQFLLDYEEVFKHTLHYPGALTERPYFRAGSIGGYSFIVTWSRIRDRVDPEPFDEDWTPVVRMGKVGHVHEDPAAEQQEGTKTQEIRAHTPVDVLQQEGTKSHIATIHMVTGFWYDSQNFGSAGLIHLVTAIPYVPPEPGGVPQKSGLVGLFHIGGNRGIPRLLASLLIGMGYVVSGHYLLTEDGLIIMQEDGTPTLLEP